MHLVGLTYTMRHQLLPQVPLDIYCVRGERGLALIDLGIAPIQQRAGNLALMVRALEVDLEAVEGIAIHLGGDVSNTAFHLPGHKPGEVWLQRDGRAYRSTPSGCQRWEAAGAA